MDTNNRIDAAKLLPVTIGVALASALLAVLSLIFVGDGRRPRAFPRELRDAVRAVAEHSVAGRRRRARLGSCVRRTRRLPVATRADARVVRAAGRRCWRPDDRFGDQAAGRPCSSSRRPCSTGAMPRSRQQTGGRERPRDDAATARGAGRGPGRCRPRSRREPEPHAERFEVRARAVEQDLVCTGRRYIAGRGRLAPACRRSRLHGRGGRGAVAGIAMRW